MTIEKVLLLLLIGWIIFVAIYPDLKQPKGTGLIRDSTETATNLLSSPIAPDLNRLHEFAFLSAASYGVETYSQLVGESENLVGLWELVLEDHTAKLLKDASEQGVVGFNYEVYQRTRLSETNESVYAIVFRGTDGLNDFWSNGHWITKFIPGVKDQYDFVRDNTSGIVDAINQMHIGKPDKLEIVVAGHSLGGGLAQQAAYSADGVKTVFTYASTAVTGFFDVDRAERDSRKEGMRIYRVHERGEILAYFRRVMGVVYPVVQSNPQITEIRYNFQNQTDNPLKLHGIHLLAINLRKAWEGLPGVT